MLLELALIEEGQALTEMSADLLQMGQAVAFNAFKRSSASMLTGLTQHLF